MAIKKLKPQSIQNKLNTQATNFYRIAMQKEEAAKPKVFYFGSIKLGNAERVIVSQADSKAQSIEILFQDTRIGWDRILPDTKLLNKEGCNYTNFYVIMAELGPRIQNIARTALLEKGSIDLSTINVNDQFNAIQPEEEEYKFNLDFDLPSFPNIVLSIWQAQR